MPVTIHLVRHAQGVHNLGNHHVRDATLTDYGKQQCRILSDTFPCHDRVKTIIVSPLRRAISTAWLSFQPAIVTNKITMIAHPVFQETGNAPCDTGLEPDDLGQDLSTTQIQPIDLTLVRPGWHDRSYGSLYVNSSYPNSFRAKLARRYLRDLIKKSLASGTLDSNSDHEIVVVSHGGFLHYLTEDWDGAQGHESVAFKNTDYRSYTIKQLEGEITEEDTKRDEECFRRIYGMTKPEKYSEISGKIDFVDDVENATLVETEESRKRRGAVGERKSREENDRLWLETVTKWQDSHIAAGWEKF